MPSSLINALLSLLMIFGLAPGARAQEQLLVFAASSLAPILPQVGKAWTEETGHVVSFSFDGSSRLAKQIEAGAPAHVFVSANEAWMDHLAERQLLVAGSRRSLLGNALVLVVPSNSPLNLISATSTDWQALPKLALAGEQVPAGIYGQAALASAGLWPELKGKVVRGQNVRTVLNWVRQTEVAAGVVYRTDALSVAKEVRIAWTFSDDSYPNILYPAAAIKTPASASKTKAELAAKFLKFCQGPVARKIFEAAGFVVDLAR